MTAAQSIGTCRGAFPPWLAQGEFRRLSMRLFCFPLVLSLGSRGTELRTNLKQALKPALAPHRLLWGERRPSVGAFCAATASGP